MDALATDVIPWRKLRGLAVRYSEFRGNVNREREDAEYVTNNHIMYRAKYADPERHKRLASMEDVAGTARDASDCVGLWEWAADHSEGPDGPELHLIGVRVNDLDSTHVARLEGPDFDSPVFVNAQYLRILQLVVDFDKITGHDPRRALTVVRDGTAVGYVMPMRGDSWPTFEPVDL